MNLCTTACKILFCLEMSNANLMRIKQVQVKGNVIKKLRNILNLLCREERIIITCVQFLRDIKYSLKKNRIIHVAKKNVILLIFLLRFPCANFYSEIRCTSFRPSIISSQDKILRLLATRRSRNSLSRASKILLDDRAKAVYSQAF